MDAEVQRRNISIKFLLICDWKCILLTYVGHHQCCLKQPTVKFYVVDNLPIFSITFWICFVLFAADRCKPPATVVNATAIVIETDSEIYMNVKCFNGHRFPDGLIEKVIQCRFREWEDFQTECTRKSI